MWNELKVIDRDARRLISTRLDPQIGWMSTSTSSDIQRTVSWRMDPAAVKWRCSIDRVLIVETSRINSTGKRSDKYAEVHSEKKGTWKSANYIPHRLFSFLFPFAEIDDGVIFHFTILSRFSNGSEIAYFSQRISSSFLVPAPHTISNGY